MSIYVGAKFYAIKHLRAAIEELQREQKVTYSITNSKSLDTFYKGRDACLRNVGLRYHYLKYTCVMGGSPVLTSKGLRQSSSFKKGCKAAVTFKYHPDGYLEVSKRVDDHNHDVSEEFFQSLPKIRRLSQSEKKEAKKLIGVKKNFRSVQAILKAKFGKQVTRTDLNNLIRASKRSKMSSVRTKLSGTTSPQKDIKKEKTESSHLSQTDETTHVDIQERNEQIKFMPEVSNVSQVFQRSNFQVQTDMEVCDAPIVLQINNVRSLPQVVNLSSENQVDNVKVEFLPSNVAVPSVDPKANVGITCVSGVVMPLDEIVNVNKKSEIEESKKHYSMVLQSIELAKVGSQCSNEVYEKRMLLLKTIASIWQNEQEVELVKDLSQCGKQFKPASAEDSKNTNTFNEESTES